MIEQIPSCVEKVIVVDDKCPDGSGKFVEENCFDKRVTVAYNPKNMGVGGAVKTGYAEALKAGASIVVKLDGDGQMDADLIPELIAPIQNGEADYVKGNRFFRIEKLSQMPTIRLIGNSALSLINKLVSGYWPCMDPTNGFTAIHRTALSMLPLEKIENRYFFESDMLFRLGTISAVVHDMPMDAKYADEVSNLSVRRVLFEFPPKYISRFFKRMFYNYFLRDFTVASIQMVLGIKLLLFGVIFGGYHWYIGIQENVPATTGTVMIATLPIILSFQLLLSALHYDITTVPKKVLQRNT